MNLKKFAEQKGWNYNRRTTNGEEKGYLFTIIQGQGFKTFLTPLTGITELAKEKVIRYLKEQKSVLKISDVDFDNSVLYIRVKETFGLMKMDNINELLSTITNYLQGNSICIDKHCVFCGEEGANEKCFINGIYYYAHSGCYEQAVEENKQEIKKYDSENKNYLLGTIGALLGGLVCTIPWIIVEYLGFFAAFLAYLIGVGALKSYKMLGGKLGPMTRWIILVVVIISVFFAEIASYAIWFIQNDYLFCNENYNLILSDADIYINIGIGLLMAFLGIFSLFNDLKGDGKSIANDLKR